MGVYCCESRQERMALGGRKTQPEPMIDWRCDPMKPKAVLFDLDGTLLPMDQDAFTKGYFKLLAKKLLPRGYEPEGLIKAIWHGVAAMVKNDGSCTNEEAFWKDFTGIYGEKALEDRPLFEEFYAVDFQGARAFCGYTPAARETVTLLKDAGERVTLATNPLFPAVATQSRIRWAGLEPEDFELYTTYENIGYCKPNLEYYREILRRMELSPRECVMVGNDVREDMIAGELGIETFLLTNCLINPEGVSLNRWPHGDFAALQAFLKEKLNLR